MKKKIAIFGAGMTGLTAGQELLKLGHDVQIYEADDHIGGLASTFRDEQGFIYDNGPRFIFSTLAEKLGIADQCERVRYLEDLYVDGKYYKFPFGFIRNPTFCASVGTAMLTRNFHRRPRNLGEFLRVYYGRQFSRQVLVPLIEKWCGLPAHEMSIDFAYRLLPTNISYIIYSLIKKLRGGITKDYYKGDRYIVYPKTSNAVIFDTLAKPLEGRVHLNSRLEGLKHDNKRITAATINGRQISADYYLSTIPMDRLAQLVGKPTPFAEWKNLQYRGILILFIKIDRPKILKHLWSWFPEPKYRFYRISEFKNALPNLAPKNKTLLAVELACDSNDPYWQKSAPDLYADLAPDLHDLYGLEQREIIGLDLRKSPWAYPVLRKETEELQRALTHGTSLENIFVAGRTGMFQYRFLEGCHESAMKCVETISKAIIGDVDTRMLPSLDRDGFGRPLVTPD